MKTPLLTLSALFLFQSFLFSQTAVPTGSVSGTWTSQGSPYNVQGDIMIDDGATLVIDPGVTVNFEGTYKLFVAGRLLAIGNEADSVIFTAANDTNGWRGIRFDNTPETNDTSMIIYCRLEYGKATGPSPEDKGGAFYFSHFSAAVISHCVIANGGSGLQGGAIFCEYSSPVITYNTISGNTTSLNGGGIYADNSSSPAISHNLISYNSTTSNCVVCFAGGGGIYCSGGNAVISDNLITHNTTADSDGGGGGGIYLNGSQIIVTRNIISYNSTSSMLGGGGIFCYESNPVISYNTISNNSSLGHFNGGGGISVYNVSSPLITNNTITNNTTASIAGGGGGLYINGSSPIITSNTIANNHSSANGGGSFFTFGSNPALLNCILWGNSAGAGGKQVFLEDEASDPSFMYCDVQDSIGGFGLNGNTYIGTYQNNLNTDPLFISPTGETGADFNGVLADWSLSCSSPCINAGYLSGSYPPVDKAGNPRVNDGRIDLGPYEFQIEAGLVFSVSTDTLILSPPANSSQIFQISSNVSWTASDNQSWLTLDKASGPCNATVKASAEENPVAETRTAIITVSGTGATDQLITVIQEAPVIEVSADTLTVEARNNSSVIFNITSNINWTLTSSQSWLTSSKLDGSGNSGITLTAEWNPADTVRTAIVTVTGTGVTDKVIVVNQEGSRSVLTVSTHSLTLAAAANSIKKFNIISNIRWNAGSDKTWLTVSPSDSTGNAEITITADANPGLINRTAIVTFSGIDVPDQVINVTQTADEPYLSVSSNTLTIAAPENSTQTFDIMSNISWNVTTDQPWLIANTTLGADSATITLTAEANATGTERTATVFVAGDNVESQLITVTQEFLLTGILNTSASGKIVAYPNPTRGQLTISLDESLQDEYQVEVLNALGDLVLMMKISRNSKTAQVNLSGYPSGFYIIRISSGNVNYKAWISKK